MKIDDLKFFNRNSTLFELRWFLLVVIFLAGTLIYANVTGWRILNRDVQEKVSSGTLRSGQRFYHK